MTKELSGKEKSLQNIQPPPAAIKKGERRAIRHGAYAFLTSGVVPCNPCILADECPEFREDAECFIIQGFQQNKISEIMALPQIQSEDIVLVTMLARELAFQAIVSKYLSKKGIFKDELAPQPVLKQYWQSVNSSIKMCEQLGLSPTSRAKLRIEKGVPRDTWFEEEKDAGRKH